MIVHEGASSLSSQTETKRFFFQFNSVLRLVQSISEFLTKLKIKA